jgi:AsmA protein
MKALKILGAVFGLLIVAIGVTFAVGVPGGFFTGMIEDQVEKETGLQLDINGGATIKLWPVTVVTLSDVAVYDPKDKVVPNRFRTESIRAELSLRDLLTGNPRVREINVVRPVISLPMARERTRQLTTATKSTVSLGSGPLPIERVVVKDATLVFKDPSRGIEDRIENINVKATATPERQVDVTVDARSGDKTSSLEIKTTVPSGSTDVLTLPVDFKIEAPGALPQALSGNADVKLNGTTITVNSLSGTFGAATFSGYAVIEGTAKPLVKVNLDFKQLDIEAPSGSKPASQGWSEEPVKLDGLNYVDAEFQISAATLNIGAVKLAPVRMEGTLASGILRMTLNELGIYEGRAAVGLALDASIANPIYAVRAELLGVRALPLLTNAANFTSLDGKMQAQLDVRTTGRNQREMIANLSGTTNVDFQDGQIRGINVAQMIRNLTSSTLTGWQEDQVQTTDLTEMHASFRIANGKAETSDLRLAGPLVRITGTGTTDLPTKSLAFRLEPKLVMTTQGQGSAVANPVGLGVPVVMEGPWTAPRIYPDMAGILDNPDAAFGKLRELGQGLFGPGFFGGAAGGTPGQPSQAGAGGRLIEGIGSIIQGLGGGAGSGQSTPGSAPPQAGQPAQPQQGGIGALIQGLGGGAGSGQSNPGSTAPQTTQPAQPGAAPQGAPPSQSQPSPNTQTQIDSIIKQLFGR